MSNNNDAWNPQMPWVPPSPHALTRLIPSTPWSHVSESIINLMASNQNPLLQTFSSPANNFGSVDLSMPNKNSNSIQSQVMGSHYILPHSTLSPAITASATTPSVIHSTASHKIGKITPIDTKILTGERVETDRSSNSSSTKSPVNCDAEISRIQTNENISDSPQRKSQTPDNHITPRTVPSEDSTDSMSTTKSRRKRKPNVTKKLTNDIEMVEEEKSEQDNEMLRMENDLRTDYSEKDMDIENDICSSERISEVCSPTTSLVIDKNLQINSHVSSSPLPAPPPIIPPSQLPNISNLEPNPKANVTNNQQDSDECETIDKIAEMVSDLTSTTNTEMPIIANPPASDPVNFSEKQEKILEDVETRLEEMFADSNGADTVQAENPPSESSSKLDKSDNVKEEKEVEIIQTPSVPITPNTTANNTTKKPVNRNRGRKEGAKRKKPVGKAKQKNGKNGGGNKMNGNSKEVLKDLKTPAQKKDVNGKAKQKSEAGYLGPILQLQKDGSFNVVNQATNGDDDSEKSLNKIKKGIINLDKNKVIRGMHVSTLSNKYDADTKDMTWICVFCKLGSHKHELGDLFGPYIISKLDDEFKLCQEDPEMDVFRESNANKFAQISKKGAQSSVASVAGPSEKILLPKKKRKLSVTSPMKSPAPKLNGTTEPNLFAGMTKMDDNTFEVWVHEDCVIWAPGVYIIGSKIVGLEAAIWTSTRHNCCFCSQNGAVLSCLHRGCNLEAHLCCAKSNKWKLDNEFKTFCEIHAT